MAQRNEVYKASAVQYLATIGFDLFVGFHDNKKNKTRATASQQLTEIEK